MTERKQRRGYVEGLVGDMGDGWMDD